MSCCSERNAKAGDAAIHIEKMLRDLGPNPSEVCIFKVPNEVRMVNAKAYNPEIISNGPYHRNKGDHLRTMEEHKARYLRALLLRQKGLSVAAFVQAMRELQGRARRCYAEPIMDIDEENFVEMLVLDGCFIVELVRKFRNESLQEPSDPIFKMEMILCRLTRDMLLLENQLPFFILSKLFEMTETRYSENSLLDMMFHFFDMFLGADCGSENVSDPPEKIDHLLGLLHNNWLPPPLLMEAYGSRNTTVKILRPMRCSTELKEAGVKFKAGKSPVLFDIKFENGTLIIPTLSIGDEADSLFRNLIAYEQFSTAKTDADHIMDYTSFFDCLINSGKDVELLCHRGIIQNFMGSDEFVANLFNRMGDGVVHSRPSIYHDTVKEVNSYCDRPWNRRIANLRHDYCNSLWSLISILAALLLLSLAFAQTIYSALSYYKQ